MKINISPIWTTVKIEDEVGLVQQLYDVYFGEETNVAKIVHIKFPESEQYFLGDSEVCYFRKSSTISLLQDSEAVAPIDKSKKKFPYVDKVSGVDVYKCLVNWDKLNDCAGKLHDLEAIEPYGQAKQKQVLRAALELVDRKSKSKTFFVSEKIFGKYSDHVASAQQIRGENSPDCQIQFISTLRKLEKDGFLKIHEVLFDFNAFPSPTEEEKERIAEGVFVDEDAYFYPAEHCQVKLELTKSNSTEAILNKQKAEQALRPTNFSPPSFSPPRFSRSALEIVNDFSPSNYGFVLKVLRAISSLAEFSSDKKVHYKIQSPAGQPIIQERMLLKKLDTLGLFSNMGEDGIFAIATLSDLDEKRIKEVILEMENRRSTPEHSHTAAEKILQTMAKKNEEGILASSRPKNSDLKENEIIEWRGLKYSYSSCEISYKGGVPKNFSPESREIRFFKALKSNQRQVVDYKDLARAVESDFYKRMSESGDVPHSELKNSDFADDAGFLRRDFRTLALLAGMPAKEFEEMIVTISKKGYKMLDD